jgi:hypothetical protein
LQKLYQFTNLMTKLIQYLFYPHSIKFLKKLCTNVYKVI